MKYTVKLKKEEFAEITIEADARDEVADKIIKEKQYDLEEWTIVDINNQFEDLEDKE